MLVHDLHVVEAHREVGPGFEERFLRPQLVVACPVVVSVEQRDVSAAGGAEPACDDLVGVKVPLGEEETDEVRVAVRVPLNDLACGVGRAVLRDQDFVGLWELLRERAVERLPNELRMVVGDDEHGHGDRGIRCRLIRAVLASRR